MKKEKVGLEEMSNYELIKEYRLLERGRRRERLITHSIYLVIIVIILLLNKCSDRKNEAEKDALKKKIESLQNQNKYLENQLANQKPVLEINQGGSVLYFSAVISDLKDDRPSHKAIHPIRVPYPVSVPTVDSSAIIMAEDCAEETDGLIALYLERDDSLNKMNKFLNDSIHICMDKHYRQDSAVIMMQRKIQLRAFLLNPPPSINYTSPPYTEYLPNPYRAKAEESFWWGAGFASAAVTAYGVSELLGHPKFYDDRDNSDAQKKSNQILGLRASTAALTIASVFKFRQAVRFYNMEGECIIGPNNIGLIIYLYKPVSKK